MQDASGAEAGGADELLGVVGRDVRGGGGVDDRVDALEGHIEGAALK